MTDVIPRSRRLAGARLRKPRFTREQQKAMRAQELLDAAWILFCEKGYEAVTIEAVAEYAGYSRQPVYTLFGDKQNLFFELQRVATAEVMTLVLSGLAPGVPLRDNLTKLAAIVATQLNRDKPPHGERLFFVAQTIALSRPEIAAKLEHEARKVLDQIAGMIRRSTLGPGEALCAAPETIAAVLAGQINGLTTVQFQTHERYADANHLAAIFIASALKPARD